MRVIAGLAKGIPLQAVEGHDTRPILDRVKESLFSILLPNLIDANIIDLFSGTASLGIEALSRGAKSCLFVDNSHKAAKTAKQNLEKTKLTDNARIIEADVFTISDNEEFCEYRGNRFNTNRFNNNVPSLEHLHVCHKSTTDSHGEENLLKFDVVIVGAPYPIVEQSDTKESLLLLFKRFVDDQIIASDGIFVLQHKKEDITIQKEQYNIEVFDTRVYGITQITFLRPFTPMEIPIRNNIPKNLKTR